MLTITESAWERLSELQASRPDVQVMRLKHDGDKVRCHRGNQKGRDAVIEQPGRPRILMTPAVAKHLSGRTLDAADTASGPRLRLK